MNLIVLSITERVRQFTSIFDCYSDFPEIFNQKQQGRAVICLQ